MYKSNLKKKTYKLILQTDDNNDKLISIQKIYIKVRDDKIKNNSTIKIVVISIFLPNIKNNS